MAVDEINATGGIDGKKLDVISRDDGANPGDAVRVAEELVSSEGVTVLAGTFLSNVGLAVGNFASQIKSWECSLAAASGSMAPSSDRTLGKSHRVPRRLATCIAQACHGLAARPTQSENRQVKGSLEKKMHAD